MNIQRFLLPGSIAAAVHVALLVALPRESWSPPVKVIAVLLGDPPLKPPEQIDPPEGKPDKSSEVRPLAGGPSLPDLDEPPLPDRPAVVTLPVEPKPISPVQKTKIIPETPGIGGVGLPGPGDWTRGINSLDSLDRVPNAKVQLPPDYPPAMRQTGTTGFVKVEFDVDPTGRVIAARAVESSHREFEEPALRAVKKWRFEPGRRNGRAVPFRMTVPIEFGIDPN